jgi:hypothetical protein
LLSEIVIILTFSCYNTAVITERLPADYQAFLQSIKTRVQHAQLKAVVAVNQERFSLKDFGIGSVLNFRNGTPNDKCLAGKEHLLIPM